MSVPYGELKAETKERRRAAHLRNPERTRDRIEDIVMKATIDNPVSVVDLKKCAEFARHCLMLGASDKDAINSVRKYIIQINGGQVG